MSNARLMSLRFAAALVCVAASTSCDRTAPTHAPDDASIAPLVDASERDKMAALPALRARAMGDVYTFFRLTNRGFTERACGLLGGQGIAGPEVALHGDMHISQYAVTQTGRGLSDFDDAGTGPAAIDLVRLMTSLLLIAQERGWPHRAALDAVVAGYSARLAEPSKELPEPSLAPELRKSFVTREQFLAKVGGMLTPLDPVAAQKFRLGQKRYVALLRKSTPHLPQHYWTLKEFGRLTGGVGSAEIRRIIVRLEGLTTAPDDDVLLEAKELPPHWQSSCVGRPKGAWHPVDAHARIGLRPNGLLAMVPRAADASEQDPPWWVQPWRADYQEMESDNLRNVEDLVAISFDVGALVANCHIGGVPPQDTQRLREQLLVSLATNGSALRTTAATLERQVRREWLQMKKANTQ